MSLIHHKLQRFGLWLAGDEVRVIRAEERAMGYREGWQDGVQGAAKHQLLSDCQLVGATLRNCYLEDCHIHGGTATQSTFCDTQLFEQRDAEATPEPHDACVAPLEPLHFNSEELTPLPTSREMAEAFGVPARMLIDQRGEHVVTVERK